MCDPGTIGVLMLASTVISAAGTGVSAISSSQQANYQAKVADANAKAESQRAIDAIDRGNIESRNYQRKLSQEMGDQNAALAANGIDLTYGSAFAVRGDTAMFGREDVKTINENARREAMGYDINASNFISSAKSAKMQASGALIQGAFGVASTALGGATQYAKFKANRGGW